MSAEVLAMAMQYHRGGDLQQAEKLYRHILQSNPRHPEALHLLGVLAHQTGHTEAAVECIRQALAIAPDFAEAHTNLANSLIQLGKLSEAEEHCRQALQLKPDFVDAYNNLGISLRRQGRPEQAAETYRQALRLQPESPFLHNNLGNVLREQGKHTEALASYDQALRLNPSFPEAHNNKGTSFQDQGMTQEALTCFKEALRLRPSYADAANNLGVVLAGHGNPDEARAFYEHALRTVPNFVDALRNLGLLLHSQGKFDEAIAQFEEVLRHKPEDATAKHLLAALTGKAAPEQSSQAYVASLFDGYAGHFDEHLVNTLKYRGPEMLQDALADLAKPKSYDILDLGCGTGLCGTVLHQWAKKLIGVDLSAKMLAKARERGLYDDLIQGDILSPLSAAKADYDLIVAWDVFSYIGELTPYFRAIKSALRPGGYFAFWVESHDEGGGPDYVLRNSGRFAHSGDYLRRLAETAGFSEHGASKQVGRIDRDKGIDCLVMVLRT